jgi:hypothetical protein
MHLLPSCAQVWYSSAWSRSTLTAFQRATTTVLAAAADGSRSSTNAPSSGGAAAAVRNHQQLWRESLTPAVVEVLRLWQQQEVALSTSRKEWLANDKQAHVQIMAFKQQADRMAMAEYMLTGQLGEAAVGSTTMFVLPPGTMRMPEEDVLKVCSAGRSLQRTAPITHVMLHEYQYSCSLSSSSLPPRSCYGCSCPCASAAATLS